MEKAIETGVWGVFINPRGTSYMLHVNSDAGHGNYYVRMLTGGAGKSLVQQTVVMNRDNFVTIDW